jgi:adenosylcobalamin-dependent ribonucleoside-diphosphate reductase
MGKGLRIPRRFTTEGTDPYSSIEWARRDSRITNPDGSVVFEVKDAEVPASWSQVATDIVVSKYFRKAGVPQVDADGNPVLDENGDPVLGSETSGRQVFDRLATTWRWWGERHGYFASPADAQAYEDEMKYMLANQIASPNSPQWFNTGLAHAYGITGTPQGFWFVDPTTGEMTESPDSYTHPAPHACFPAGARITTRDGVKFIEKIEPGDEVFTHLGRYRPVSETMQRQIDEELVTLSISKLTGEHFTATANHPVLAVRRSAAKAASTRAEWVAAGELEVGDFVVVSRPTSSETVPAPIDLADYAGATFEVTDTHVVTRQRALRVGADLAYRVEAVERIHFYGTVYNFQVEEDESYIANGVVVHNCFIQNVTDDLVNPGGIMDLWVREARLFKMGSGTGSNFSQIRAENERLSGGGKSSGVMGFLRIGDRAAGAIKSGGTTRRAAKMVILDLDHPDIEEFIDWKMHEENKARVLIQHGGYPADFNGEAYATVSGQNSNNSVRVPNEFIEAVRNDGDWQLIERTSGRISKTMKARDLWRKVAEAAWACADPGVQFDTVINEWHTSPAGGKIRATNPCSEYVFLDDTACNLASINLVKFYDDATGIFDTEGYEQAIRMWTITLEISVTMAHFPSREIAQGSYDYRTLGLGYANLGTLLMRMGLPYDSNAGRAVSGAITAILTGYAYATSAELASAVGPFPRFAENREAMLRVIRNHRRAAYNSRQFEFEGLSHYVMGINPELTPANLLTAARQSWDLALDMGERHGYRNAQVTVIAPTGCLVGGSLVPTERGLVRLGTLGDPRGSQWQGLGVKVGTDQGARTATQFYLNGAEPVVTVNTVRGYRIQGTPTHRIKVVAPDGTWAWKRFAEVAKDDLVPVQMKQLIGEPQTVKLPPLGDAHWTADFATTVPRTMTPELAEFVGYFMGEGSLHSKGIRLTVTAGDFEVVERFSMLGKQLFNLEARLTDKIGYVEVAFHSVPLAMWWEACGFAKRSPREGHTGKGWHPHIPDAVLASNDREVYGAFVRGLFEAEGYVHQQGYPSWTTTSLDFSRDVQSLLLALGYPTTRKFDTTGWSQSSPATLRLANSSYSKRWATEIGFISARKQSAVTGADHQQGSRRDYVPVPRDLIDELAPANDSLRKMMLLSLSRLGMVSRRSAEALFERTGDLRVGHLLGFFYDRVAATELGDEQWTYDLSVPENVTYIANGFVSHNTIGLQMDCDTTGVEPDFALVKFKKLAGGGYFKIVNQSVTPALENLGYDAEQIEDIVRYIVGTSSLEGAPHINRGSLIDKGFTDEDLAKIEKTLPAVFELRHAFNPFVLGEAAMQRLGFTPDEYATFEFDLLRSLGFSTREIREATEWVCGQQMIEGAPHLEDEHLAVFDTANRNGRIGQRLIHHSGHIKMLAATQPFLSGAASKTINMPNEATVEDIEESYMLSYELGVKCMALYRDGSKASQPLSASSDDAQSEDEPEEVTRAHEIDKQILWGKIPAGLSPTQAYAQGMHPPRFLLPARRSGYTQEAKIGGHKVYLRTGEYQDGTLGEVFIDLAKEGATLRGILSCFAIAVSKGLQFGVPLEEFVDTFTFQTFEPRGLVEGHPNIKMANSIVDYVFRALAVEYLKRDDLAQVPPTREGDLPEPASGLAVETGVQLDLTDAVAESDVVAVASAVKFLEAKSTLPAAKPAPAARAALSVGAKDVGTSAMQSALSEMMGDAPLCDICGHITIRNGSCYKCLNCGNSLGCS